MADSNAELVTWERWFQTFFHPLHPMGVYQPKSKNFSTYEAASGFAEALKLDAMNRNVRVNGWQAKW